MCTYRVQTSNFFKTGTISVILMKVLTKFDQDDRQMDDLARLSFKKETLFVFFQTASPVQDISSQVRECKSFSRQTYKLQREIYCRFIPNDAFLRRVSVGWITVTTT